MFHLEPTANSIEIIYIASTAKLAVMYRKTLLKIKKCSNHLWFNKQCIKESLHPKFMKISCNNSSPEAQLSIRAAYSKWLNEEMHKWYQRRDNLQLHLKLIHEELVFKLIYDDFQETDRIIREEVQEQVHQQYINQLKKLEQLRQGKQVKQKVIDQHKENSSFNFYDRVVNLTDVTFENSELNMLEKGLKYCPDTCNTKDIEMLATKTELILDVSLKPLQDKYIIAQKFNSNNVPKHTNSENRIIKQIKNKIASNNLIISKADKGNTLTIMTDIHYKSKMENLISSDDFVELKSDPTATFHRSINKEINNYKQIFNVNNPNFLRVMNPTAPVLYGMPKLHKDNVPMRPVVSYINAPSYKLCKDLASNLPKVINCTSPYSVKNSLELVETLKLKNLPNNSKFISFDVKSLFTSIPTPEVKSILKALINNSNLTHSNQTNLFRSIEICLDQNYFKFNSKIYKQTNGLPMGSPLSPLLAEVFMANFENILFSTNMKESLVKYIYFWARYVDDIFCIWTGTDRQLSKFLTHLNNINKNIEFTIETEENCSLNFLDLKISRKNNTFDFDIFRKPTTTDTIIHANSNQSWQIKMSAFHSLIHRLLSVPLSQDNYQKEVNIIKTIATNNGYSPSIINKLIRNKKHKNIQKQFYTHHTQNDCKNKKWFAINYVSGMSNKISNNFRKLGINCISVNKNNLAKVLVNNKEKSPKNQKSGIYKICCNECDATYIGQTGRSLQNRIKEHRNSILSNNRNTGFAEHCIDNNHFFNNGDVKLLHNIQKGKQMDYLEILAIKKSIDNKDNITNTQTDFVGTPILDAAIKII